MNKTISSKNLLINLD